MAAIFRAAFGYCFLVFMVRIAGRRPGKQITPFEFVLIFFIGGVTLTPMVGDDRSRRIILPSSLYAQFILTRFQSSLGDTPP